MEIRIINRNENEFFNRLEVKFEVQHAGKTTPKRDEARELLAKETNSSKELVIIKKLKTKIGNAVSVGYADIYKEKEKMLSSEPKHLLIRNDVIKKEKKEDGKEKEGSKKEG